MAVSNITNVEFGNLTMVETEPHYQYDYGQKLKFTDLNLPSSYEVHFSNEPTYGDSITMMGDSSGVDIPDELMQTGLPVYAFIFLHQASTDGRTAYVVRIPIRQRARPTDYVPRPRQKSALDQAQEALDQAVDLIENSSFIYTGTNAPQDEKVSVWINPNGDSFIDETLTKKGIPADAKAVGDAVNNAKPLFSDDGSGNVIISFR